jgi:hypothetical protein
MTAIPHAALALTSALDRFGHASARVLEAVTGADEADLGAALVEMSAAKTQAKAGVTVIHFADEMYEALLEIRREP